MKLSYLTWLRSRIGTSKEELTLPREVNTVIDLIGWLSKKDQKYGVLLVQQQVINISLNGTLVKSWEEQPVTDSDQIVFFSPLAGG